MPRSLVGKNWYPRYLCCSRRASASLTRCVMCLSVFVCVFCVWVCCMYEYVRVFRQQWKIWFMPHWYPHSVAAETLIILISTFKFFDLHYGLCANRFWLNVIKLENNCKPTRSVFIRDETCLPIWLSSSKFGVCFTSVATSWWGEACCLFLCFPTGTSQCVALSAVLNFAKSERCGCPLLMWNTSFFIKLKMRIKIIGLPTHAMDMNICISRLWNHVNLRIHVKLLCKCKFLIKKPHIHVLLDKTQNL